MSSIKTYNPISGKWEVASTSQAIETGVIDLNSNFNSNNVEGALNELGTKNKENTSKINVIESTTNDLIGDFNKLDGDFSYHLANHPSGSGTGDSSVAITSTFEGGVVDNDTDLYIPIFFTSPNTGNGTLYVLMDDIEINMINITQGNNRVHIGVLPKLENKISIYVKDSRSVISKPLNWTVIKGGIDLTLNFDYNADYSVDDIIRMPYVINTPLTEELKLNIVTDSVKKEIITKNGVGEYIFEDLSVGIHKISVSVTCGVYKSKTYNFNLIIVNSYNLYVSSTLDTSKSFEYGTPIIVDYRISKLSSEQFNTILYLDGVAQKTLRLSTGSYTWTISNMATGSHTIKIVATSDLGETSFVELSVVVIQGEYIPVEPITSGLQCWFDATDMTNDDINKEIWIDKSGNNTIATLHNFNFRTNGWIENTLADGSKEKVLCCDNDAYVEMDLKPYADNIKLGSTIDILYNAKNIGLENARVLDYTDIEQPYKGIYVDVVNSVFKSATNVGDVKLDEDSEIRLTFVVDRTNKFGLIYINAVLSRAFYLSDSGSGVNKFYEDFTHNQKIYLNSEKGIKNFGACDIKQFRVYNRALSSDEILQNHIADIKDINKQKEKFNFNNIEKNNNIPKIKIYGDDYAIKNNMNETTPVTCRIKYESINEDFYGQSFDLPYCDVTWQGTSSLQYVLKNYTIRLKDENMKEYLYTPYKNGILESVFCLKADYMESSHANNVGLAKFVHNCLYDTKTPAQLINPNYRTTVDGFPVLVYINDELKGAYNFNLDRYSTHSYGYENFSKCLVYEVNANTDTTAGAFYSWNTSTGKDELTYYKSDFECLYPPSRQGNDNYAELIRLVKWVDTSSDEVFKDQINEYFNLEYLLRYYLETMVMGLVDSLGKNMKLVTYDGSIWFPEFYDMDTAQGLDNTGFLKHDSDIEVQAGIFQTSGSKLWEKVRRLFAVELEQQYALMRLDRFTVDNIMKYVCDEQIKMIPEKVFNMDMKTKYLDFQGSYLYACHGNREQQMKRWIRERIAYCDTLMKYTNSTSDYITIRANKLGQVYLDVQTYIPMYITVKFRDEPDTIINGQITNAGKITKRVGRGETVRFEYNLPTATNQEVILYAGKHLKSIGDLSNLQPEALLISNAYNLTNIKCTSPNLIQTDLSKMKNLQYIDLSNCSLLGTTSVSGTSKTLDLSNCNYLKKVDVRGTKLTAIYTNLLGGSIEEIYYPSTVQDINIRNQDRLKIIGLPCSDGNMCTSLANFELQNCSNVQRLSEVEDNTIPIFKPIKYTQKLSIKNSLQFIKNMDFSEFNRLTNVTIDNMSMLENCKFDNLSNLNGVGVLGNIKIANCPKISALTFNVNSADKSIVFADNSILDLSEAFTLKRIESNTPILGLKTIILNRDIEDLIFKNDYAEHNFNSSIDNLWSYLTSADNTNKNYSGIDFKDLFIKNIDLTSLKHIVNNKNFNIKPVNDMIINQPRDGIVYPYLIMNGTIDLTDYSGSCVGLFKNFDLSNVTIIRNTDFTQTDFTSMFEGAIFGENTNISGVLNRITNPTSLNSMFKNSNISNCIDIPNIKTNHTRDSMYENCTSLTNVSDIAIDKATSITSMFKGCTNLISMPIKNIPDNITSIYNLYSGCTKITSADDIVFGSGITNCTDWRKGTLITSADNIVVNFNDLNSLFEDCTTLVHADNCTINGNNCNYMFRNCTSLISVDNLIIKNATSTNGTFHNCKNLHTIDFANCNMILSYGTFNLCGGNNLLIKNLKVYNTTVNETWLRDTYVTFENLTITNQSVISTLFQGTNKYSQNALIGIQGLTLDGSITDLSNMFKECIYITQDILIPSNISNVSNMYNGCTGLTHIHSNWNNTYTNTITPTNCYSGCKNIKYIDNIDVVTNEYTSGLDSIPTAWGGYDFSVQNTGIYKIVIPSANYTFSFPTTKDVNNGTTALLDNQVVNWGDGSVTTGSYSHTYTKAGTYIIKGKLHCIYNSVTSSMAQCITDIFQYPTLGNLNGAFRAMTNLKTANIQSLGQNKTLFMTFANCSSLTNIFGIENWDTTNILSVGNTFSDSAIKTINLTAFNKCNADSWAYAFSSCRKLEEIIGMDSVNLSKVTSFSNMFENCVLLKDTPIKNMPNTVTNIDSMYKNCFKITSDIQFGSGITSAISTFENCTGITNIRSNWNNTYLNTITATNCYLGCNNIKYIDNIDVITNEYASGLDNVPTTWGGYGFSKDVTGMYKIVLPSDNHTFAFSTKSLLDNQVVNWGDGTVTTGSYSHTYTKAGTYIIKGKLHCTSSDATSSMKQCITDILQYPIQGNLAGAFRGMANLKTANIQSLGGNISLSMLFYDCANLTNVYGMEDWDTTNIESMVYAFYGCSSIKTINLTSFNKCNVSEWMFTFEKCTKLEEIIGIDSVDFSKATRLISMFQKCTSLKNTPIKNIPSTVTSINSMYKNCTSITSDILIGSSVTSVASTFENCTGITHIHSNWNNTYTNTITATDCYKGCTNITHIDNIETLDCLDQIPLNWGGYGMSNNVVDVLVIDSTKLTNNYISLDNSMYSKSESTLTKWGDGVTDTLSYHTYSSNGNYTIKTQAILGGNSYMASQDVRNSLVEVKNVGYDKYNTPNGYYCLYKNCTNLRKVTFAINYKMDKVRLIDEMFKGCTSLTEIINFRLTK